MAIENWKTFKLEDLGAIITGKTPSSKNPEHFGSHLPFVTPTDFSDYHKNASCASRSLSLEGAKVFKSKILPPNSILVTCIGSQMGKVVVNKTEVLTNQQLNSVIPHKNLNSDFLYYKLSSIHEQLRTMAGAGSTMPMLNKTDFGKIEIEIPEIEEQKAIASILSALDDKIENNLQINKTLEEMAMALYKHWFVDFGPFQDGEFVDSELGAIPKGWEVKKLNDFAELIMGQSPKSKFYNDQKDGLPFHQGVKDYGLRFPEDITYSTEGNREAEKGDVLFSVRAPVGRLNIAKNKIILGRGLAAIRLKENNSFLFYSLKRMFTKEDSIGSGTVFNSVNKTDLQNLVFVIPSEKILRDFKIIVEPMDKNYSSNSKENKILTQIRNTMLPRLISGEVRVKDVEKILSEVL